MVLVVMISSGVAKTQLRIIVINGIRIIIYHIQRCLVLLHVGSHPKLLVLVLMNVLGVMLRQLNMARDQLSAAIYQINRSLFIHLPVLNQVGLHEVNQTIIMMNIIQNDDYEVLDNQLENGVLTIL